jgi:DNA repair exonuclease SbcCD nuclease subunit
MWGAKKSADGSKLLKGFSETIAKETMRRMKLSYLLLGHVHEYQTMLNGRLIYPGSLLQTRFNESPEKGVVLLDIKKKKSKFIPIENPTKLLTATNLKDINKNDLYRLSITSREQAIKILPRIPSNVVKVHYPLAKHEVYEEDDVARKKVGWRISLVPIIVKILKKQGVSDIKPAVKYLLSVLGSKDELLLP